MVGCAAVAHRVLGLSAKLNVIVPVSGLTGTADYAGQPIPRNLSGFGDPLFKLSVSLVRAPALSLKVKAMGSNICKSQVSSPCGKLDARVRALLNRPIEGDWPYLWVDATYVKTR
jgi:Transposase, Mutator family